MIKFYKLNNKYISNKKYLIGNKINNHDIKHYRSAIYYNKKITLDLEHQAPNLNIL